MKERSRIRELLDSRERAQKLKWTTLGMLAIDAHETDWHTTMIPALLRDPPATKRPILHESDADEARAERAVAGFEENLIARKTKREFCLEIVVRTDARTANRPP